MVVAFSLKTELFAESPIINLTELGGHLAAEPRQVNSQRPSAPVREGLLRGVPG
jgi:hypothetical protein